MKTRLLHIYLCIAIVLCSCGNQKLQRQLDGFTRKEVVIPRGLKQLVSGRDSVLVNPTMGVARLVIWNDSISCSSCRLKNMFDYDRIIHFREEVEDRFTPVFIFSPHREMIGEMRRILETSQFDYSIFIDEKHAFPAANPHIPADSRFHTFLIDKNGKVVLVGDPVNNPPLWELYKSTITTLIENDGVMPPEETKK